MGKQRQGEERERDDDVGVKEAVDCVWCSTSETFGLCNACTEAIELTGIPLIVDMFQGPLPESFPPDFWEGLAARPEIMKHDPAAGVAWLIDSNNKRVGFVQNYQPVEAPQVQLTPRQALEKIRELATNRLTDVGCYQSCVEIEKICDDLLAVPKAPPLPIKTCSACALAFQFNEQLTDHTCPGCGEDLCPSCECCKAP